MQQLREAFPFEQLPRYLLRDRDGIFGGEFRKDVKAMGIQEVLSAARSPWQRAYVERVIGTIRRECLELIRMAKWLQARKVASVAMESTGVYWIAPHEVLEAEGLEMMLVDTRQLARVPGRDKKSDPFDCEWIQRLHSCGLLMGSFRPKEAVCMLRTLVRDKGNLVAEAGDWLRRIEIAKPLNAL